MKFARENVGGDHSQRGALAGKQGDAESRIAGQGHAPSRPESLARVDVIGAIHADLAYPVEIQIAGGVERVQNPWTFPAAFSETISQPSFLGFNVWRHGSVLIRKNKKEHGAVAAHGEATHLAANLRIHHIGKFVSRTIARGFKCGDLIPEIFFKPALGAKDQFAHARMESVRADDEIEIAGGPTLKRDAHGRLRLLDNSCAIAEDGFHAA